MQCIISAREKFARGLYIINLDVGYVLYFLDFILGLEYFPVSVISKTFWDIQNNKNPNNLFPSLENIPGPYH